MTRQPLGRASFGGLALIAGALALGSTGLPAGCKTKPATPPSRPAAKITKGPILQCPGPNEMTILWETSPDAGPAVVRYGKAALDRKIDVPPAAAVQSKSSSSDDSQVLGLRYQARLTGLAAGTEYQYQVEVAGSVTPAASFRTFPDKPGRITFIAYGDSRSRPAVHGKLARQFAKFQPAFAVHTGDYVAKGAHWQEWKEMFFDPTREVFDRIPLLPARGNHEGRGPEFLQNFATPSGKTWYSFDCGEVHFVCLDCLDSPEMLSWCEKDLAESKARWKIVYFHHPMYNINAHASASRRESYLPLFRRHGVDLVLTGHSHIYERFFPLRPSYDAAPKPMTHIVTGGGGAPLGQRELIPHPYVAAKSDQPHFLVVTIDGDRLACRMVGADGGTIDSFAFSQENGAYDDEYMALVKDEALLQLETVQLRIRSRARPALGVPYEFQLEISRPGVPGEVKVALTIAPQCADVYRLTPETVHAVIKPGEKCLVPMTITPLREVKRVEDWLVPELRFQYRYEYGGLRNTLVKKARYWW